MKCKIILILIFVMLVVGTVAGFEQSSYPFAGSPKIQNNSTASSFVPITFYNNTTLGSGVGADNPAHNKTNVDNILNLVRHAGDLPACYEAGWIMQLTNSSLWKCDTSLAWLRIDNATAAAVEYKDFYPDNMFLSAAGAGSQAEWFTGKADVIALDADVNESLGFSYLQPMSATASVLLGWTVKDASPLTAVYIEDFNDQDVSDWAGNITLVSGSPNFAIGSSAGTMVITLVAGSAPQSITRTPTLFAEDVEVLATIQHQGVQPRAGIVLRYVDADHWLSVNLHDNGNSIYASYEKGSGFAGGQLFCVGTWGKSEWFKWRLRLQANDLKVRIWNNTTAEPADWTCEGLEQNHTRAPGNVGFWGTGNAGSGKMLIDDIEVFDLNASATNISIAHIAMDYNCTSSGEWLNASGNVQSGTVEKQIIIAPDAQYRQNQTAFNIPTCSENDYVDVTLRRGGDIDGDTWGNDFGVLWARSKIGG